MAVDALQENALAVDEHALAGAEFDGAESELLMHRVHHGVAQLQPHFELVEIRRFGGPQSRIINLPGEMGDVIEGDILRGYRISDGLPLRSSTRISREALPALAAPARVSLVATSTSERARRSGIDGQVIDERLGHGFEINRPEDAGVIPVVAAALRVVDGRIHGVIVDVDLDLVLLSGRLQQTRDVVLESVVATLVNGPAD